MNAAGLVGEVVCFGAVEVAGLRASLPREPGDAGCRARTDCEAVAVAFFDSRLCVALEEEWWAAGDLDQGVTGEVAAFEVLWPEAVEGVLPDRSGVVEEREVRWGALGEVLGLGVFDDVWKVPGGSRAFRLAGVEDCERCVCGHCPRNVRAGVDRLRPTQGRRPVCRAAGAWCSMRAVLERR